MTEATRNQMHTKSALKVRGWTEGLIRRLLAEPDDTHPNPRYRSAAPVQLWDAERVEAAHGTEAWTIAQTKLAPRRAKLAPEPRLDTPNRSREPRRSRSG